jgi:phospholipid/cholesterol/gamma-HCH transport system substrate-binding protein
MTHFKLGLFTLSAIAAVIVVMLALGWHRQSELVTYHTYFDESVQGLDVGGAVRYRGVIVGSVSEVRVAPDNKHVDAVLSLDRKVTRRLGLETPPPELRAQLGSQGITGVKYVDLNFFDPSANPPPVLPFEVAKNTIPSTPSLFSKLENNIESVVQRLPELIDTTTASLHTIESMLRDMEAQQVPARVAKTIGNVDDALGDIRKVFAGLDRARIPEKAGAALDDLGTAVAKVNGMLDAMGGDAGLVASTRRAADSIGELGRTTTGSARDLERTLRDLDEAAQAIHELATSIDREPEMLVKGRAKERRQ